MPVGGGGGAGNVAGGSNPAGVGSSINYIGEPAYAYSCLVTVNNNTVTSLTFTTGNSYFVGQLQTTGNMAQMGGNTIVTTELSLNGSKIIKSMWHSQSAGEDASNDLFTIIIPAYTVVLVELSTNEAVDRELFSTLTGRIYA